jgi:hypothetical protein
VRGERGSGRRTSAWPPASAPSPLPGRAGQYLLLFQPEPGTVSERRLAALAETVDARQNMALAEVAGTFCAEVHSSTILPPCTR